MVIFLFDMSSNWINIYLITKLKIILSFGRGIAIGIFAGLFPRPSFSLSNSMGLFSCCLEISRFTHVMSRNHNLSDISFTISKERRLYVKQKVHLLVKENTTLGISTIRWPVVWDLFAELESGLTSSDRASWNTYKRATN